MSNPYVGEIRIFGGNFAPAGWMFCDGQLMSIAENEVLFTLLGTTYGGDGQETFALPDLRGRVPLHQGGGFILAETGGAEEVTLTVQQIPSHNHAFLASQNPPTQSTPQGGMTASNVPNNIYRSLVPPPPQVSMNANMVGPVGGSQPHTNLQPYVCLNFIISLFGRFPQPS